ncbi:MAG TPA: hypothetical protein GX707_09160 [Epulopiscium sp.]|nr:hypothetical protein [Candidatus Epulonipiscium sp.]
MIFVNNGQYHLIFIDENTEMKKYKEITQYSKFYGIEFLSSQTKKVQQVVTLKSEKIRDEVFDDLTEWIQVAEKKTMFGSKKAKQESLN